MSGLTLYGLIALESRSPWYILKKTNLLVILLLAEFLISATCRASCPADDANFPVRLDLPQYHQSTDYSCGPSAAHSVLLGLGFKNISESDLTKQMRTSKDVGTSPENLGAAINRIPGLHAKVRPEISLADVAAALTRKHAMVLLVQLAPDWDEVTNAQAANFKLGDDSHWVAVTGYNPVGFVRLMDPWFSEKPVVDSASNLSSRWWGKVDRLYHHLGVEIWKDSER